MTGLLPGLIMLVGYWRLTEPDPARSAEIGLSVRDVARWGMVLSFVFQGLGDGLALGSGLVPAQAAQLTGQIIGIVGFLTLLVYVRPAGPADSRPVLSIQHADSNVGLRSSTRHGSAHRGFSPDDGIGGGLGARTGGGPFGALVAIVAVPACLTAIAAIVFGIWSIVLAVQYRQQFRGAAAEARRTWAPSAV